MVKFTFKKFKWNKIYSLVTYDFQNDKKTLKYRETLIRGYFKWMTNQLEHSSYSENSENSVDYIKNFYNVNGLFDIKNKLQESHKKGLVVIRTIIQDMNLDSVID